MMKYYIYRHSFLLLFLIAVSLLNACQKQAEVDIALLEGHLEQGDHVFVTNYCKQFLAKNPDNADAHYYNGLGTGMSGNAGGAIEDFNKAIRLNPKHAKAWSNKGLALFRLYQNVEARQCFEKAIEIDPKYARAYHNRGTLNFTERKKNEACMDWKMALDLGFKDKNRYWELQCRGK